MKKHPQGITLWMFFMDLAGIEPASEAIFPSDLHA